MSNAQSPHDDQTTLGNDSATRSFKALVVSVDVKMPVLGHLKANPHLDGDKVVLLDPNPESWGNLPTFDVGFIVVALEQLEAPIRVIQIADALARRRIPAFAIALVPLGAARTDTTSRVPTELRTISRRLTTFVISQDALLQHRADGAEIDDEVNLSLRGIQHIQDVQRVDLPAAIERFVFALSSSRVCSARISIELQDFLAMLDHTRIAAMGHGSADESEGLAVAIDRALHHPLLGSDALLLASGIAVVLEVKAKDLPMATVRGALDQIRRSISDQGSAMFSVICDPKIPVAYRVTLIVAQFEPEADMPEPGPTITYVAASRKPKSSSIVLPFPSEYSEEELQKAATLIETKFQPGMAIRGPVVLIQIHLRIGYRKAVAIVHALEATGIIAPATDAESSSFSHRRAL